MKEKKKAKQTEPVRINKDVVNLVREDKKKTKLPIGAFFELAAIEKLNKNA